MTKQKRYKKKKPWYTGWLLIIITSILIWPVGMMLLFLKLSDTRREKEASIPKEEFRSYSKDKSCEENDKSIQIERSTLNAIKMSRIIVPIILLVAGASLTYQVAQMVVFGYHRDLFFQIVVNVGWLIGAIALASICIKMSQRQNRFYQYIGIIQHSNNIPVKQLCSETGYAEELIIEDLYEMKKRLFFGQNAHFDDEKQIFYR